LAPKSLERSGDGVVLRIPTVADAEEAEDHECEEMTVD
jgi:hypothetical protein